MAKDTYEMYRIRRMLKPEAVTSIVAKVESQASWFEYKDPEDSNGMTVHQWIHDLDEAEWRSLYGMAWSMLNVVNDETWRFRLTGWQQPLRVAKYTPGLSHDWHVDYTREDRSKVAFSMPLNDDYQGGQLQMLEAGDIRKPEVGEAVFFPAYQGHRVTPVTEGTRYVLLGWATGPRFR